MLRILLTLLASALCFGADAPVRVLILTGQTDLPYHDWKTTTPFLRTALEKTGRFEVKVAEQVPGITAATLAPFDVLVLNYNGPRFGRQTEQAIEEFIRSGKGLLSFHGVSYGEFFGMEYNKRWVASATGDKGWPAYPEILGATWKPENIGHGQRHVFPVKWVDRGHPVSRGLDETFLANDELYHKLDLLPGTHVLATAFSDPQTGGTGRNEPIIWTTSYVKGRTMHITLGHDLSSLAQPGFLASFMRGVEWAATGAVTPPPPRKAAVRVLVVTGGHAYPASFYTLFEGYDDIAWRHATSQTEAFKPNMKDRFDVVVLHDFAEKLGESEQAALKAFVESGKGVVSTHHAIMDYTSWPWWYEEVTGGKYFQRPLGDHPASTYKEGVEWIAKAAKGAANHPVLRGVGPLVLADDEVYAKMWQSPKIKVLMETDHPLNDKPVVYIGPYEKARVVYIQPGHSEATMRNPGYRKLIHNAILWAAQRTN